MFWRGKFSGAEVFSEPATFQSGLLASAPVARAVQRAVEPPIGPSFFGPCHQASFKVGRNSPGLFTWLGNSKYKQNDQTDKSGLEVSPVPFQNKMAKLFLQRFELCILQVAKQMKNEEHHLIVWFNLVRRRFVGGVPLPLIVQSVAGMLWATFAALLGQPNSRHVNNKPH